MSRLAELVNIGVECGSRPTVSKAIAPPAPPQAALFGSMVTPAEASALLQWAVPGTPTLDFQVPSPPGVECPLHQAFLAHRKLTCPELPSCPGPLACGRVQGFGCWDLPWVTH